MSVQVQKDTFQGLIQNLLKRANLKLTLKEDIVAAFSIALVTIPLSLGIAIASGVPPMAGLFSAIIGGIIATFFRGSHLTVNGPATSLIVVTITCIHLLGDGNPLAGFRYFLAASFFAGLLLMILGMLRFGRYGDIFPGSVIYGVLGAIGLIILGSQVPVGFGVESEAITSFDSLTQIPRVLFNQNPFIGIITIVSLGILIGHSYIKHRWIKAVPAAIWVILFALGISYALNFHHNHEITLFGNAYQVGPSQLVDVPTDFSTNIFFPDFDKIQTLGFWQIVLAIALIVTIETFISAKAMDRIDPQGRQTNLNKDLFACGMSTSLSSLVGGLPVITAVPMYYGAKTKWANFFQGIILLLFILFVPFLIHGIPLAALATLLIFTGYKLASPKIFKDTYRLGLEQFVILAITMIIILFKGVLLGTIFGFLAMLALQASKSNLKKKRFMGYLLRPRLAVSHPSKEEAYIEAKGVFNFINILSLKNTLRSVRNKKQVVLDLSDTRLVDSTVLEYLHDEAEKYDIPKVKFNIIGLDAHETSSRHPNALHVLPENKKPQLTRRQQSLDEIALRYDGQFWPEIRWDVSQFKSFVFLQNKPIDYKINTSKGNYHLFIEWESCDVTFEQGPLFNANYRHCSVIVMHLPFNPPLFTLRPDKVQDKVGTSLSFYKNIELKEYPGFSYKYVLESPNEEEAQEFFSANLINYLEEFPHYHVESSGSMVLIFKDMRFASPHAMDNMHKFSSQLAKELLENWKKQAMQMKL